MPAPPTYPGPLLFLCVLMACHGVYLISRWNWQRVAYKEAQKRAHIQAIQYELDQNHCNTERNTLKYY